MYWVTSHCLTEASNSLGQTDRAKAIKLLETLKRVCGGAKEAHIGKDAVFKSKYCARFGVSDTGFIQKSKRVTCSFTADLDLYLAVGNLGRKAVNFNHIRESYLLA